jgi:hypothetical protein
LLFGYCGVTLSRRMSLMLYRAKVEEEEEEEEEDWSGWEEEE